MSILQIPKVKEEIKAEAHKLMQRQVHQMNRLVDDLMAISRISKRRIELKKQTLYAPSFLDFSNCMRIVGREFELFACRRL